MQKLMFSGRLHASLPGMLLQGICAHVAHAATFTGRAGRVEGVALFAGDLKHWS